MKSLLYGFAETPGLGEVCGLQGEHITPVGDGVVALVGHTEAAPLAEKASVLRYSEVVQELAGACDPFLPARFGSLFEGQELESLLALHREPLAAGLAQVRGCQQMTLRVFGEPKLATGDAPSGTSYLERQRALPGEVAQLRELLRPWVAAERLERSDSPPLLASLFHLVSRARIAEYLRCLEKEAPTRHCTWSGPWAAYAFAPAL